MIQKEFTEKYPAHGEMNPIPRGYTEDLFVTQYPGIYPERARVDIEAFFALNEKINRRGPVDTTMIRENRIPEDYPGYSGKCTISREFATYVMEKWDPDNRLYNDEEYARSLGYEGLPLYFTFSMFYYLPPFPISARDVFTPCNISHKMFNHKRIYVGDTIYCFIDEQYIRDMTPAEGSTTRSVAITCNGSAYNQKGELVATVQYNVMEHLRIMKDPSLFDGIANTPAARWDAPNWWKRPLHYYSDSDWDRLRDIWSREYVRGSTPLYWEDVSVGDSPALTLEGPVDDGGGDANKYNGLGVGGSRTLKKEILDLETFKTMVRNPYDGIYRFPSRGASFPEPPKNMAVNLFRSSTPEEDDAMSKPGHRYHFINTYGRDIALRHIYNWCGDYGEISYIGWSIMSPEALAECGKPGLPEHPDYVRYHRLVPGLPPVTAHGLEGDVAIVKSKVVEKYIRDDKHYVRLAWWIETIEGDIWQEGEADVKLPSSRPQFDSIP